MGRHDDSRESVRQAVTAPGGAVDESTLRTLHGRGPVHSPALSDWASRVRSDATTVTDAHLEALQQTGMSEAAVVAATVAAAVGEADRKLAVVEALRARRKEAKR
jgi:hypothetical protein